MNRTNPGADITHKGVRMQVCRILSQGNENTKDEITACRYHKGKPLTRSPECIGIEWEAEEKKGE